jgi:hypothetical protein
VEDLDRAEKRLHVAMNQYPAEPLIISLQGKLHACRDHTPSRV